jgi:predicted small lipoprotein YifL
MKTMFAPTVVVALVISLGGCATRDPQADGLAGFPIDEKCADFYAKSPIYGGNRVLAYGGNCVSVGM